MRSDGALTAVQAVKHALTLVAVQMGGVNASSVQSAEST